MSTERASNALKSLHELTGRIRSSMRYGVPLPVDTTKKWAQELEFIEAELRDCTGIREDAPVTGLARDFTVIANY